MHIGIPLLISHTDHLPAKNLVHPGPPAPGMPRDESTAHYVTMRSPYIKRIIRKAAKRPAAVAEAGDSDKQRGMNRTLRSALHF